MKALTYVNRALRHRQTGEVATVISETWSLSGIPILRLQLGNGGQDTLSLHQVEVNYEWLDGVTVLRRTSAEIIQLPTKRVRIIPIQPGPAGGSAA